MPADPLIDGLPLDHLGIREGVPSSLVANERLDECLEMGLLPGLLPDLEAGLEDGADPGVLPGERPDSVLLRPVIGTDLSDFSLIFVIGPGLLLVFGLNADML